MRHKADVLADPAISVSLANFGRVQLRAAIDAAWAAGAGGEGRGPPDGGQPCVRQGRHGAPEPHGSAFVMLGSVGRPLDFIAPALKHAADMFAPALQHAFANFVAEFQQAVAKPSAPAQTAPAQAAPSPSRASATASAATRSAGEQINNLGPGASLTIGCDKGRAQVRCHNPFVGGAHATIARNILGNLSVTNVSGLQTSVERNGRSIPVAKNAMEFLLPGDVIRLGGARGETFRVPPAGAHSAGTHSAGTRPAGPAGVPGKAAAPAPEAGIGTAHGAAGRPATPAKTAPAPSSPIVTGPAGQQRSVVARIRQLAATNDSFIVGSKRDMTGVCANNRHVSLRHARVFHDARGTLRVEDLNSAKGTVIERGDKTIKVKPGQTPELLPGDILRLGGGSGLGFKL